MGYYVLREGDLFCIESPKDFITLRVSFGIIEIVNQKSKLKENSS